MAYLTAEKKQELFGQYGKSNTDTGSPESQIAAFAAASGRQAPRVAGVPEGGRHRALPRNREDAESPQVVPRKKWRQFPRGVAFIFVAKNNSKTL